MEPLERLRRLTLTILSSQHPASTLWPEIRELAAVLEGLENNALRRTQEIEAGETRTANGLALSPTMASLCLDDFVRTIQFLRGTHAAITDLKASVVHRPVRVLYVGCGPYATLALPLMTVLTKDDAVFTLLDIHPESITNAKSIINQLGLDDSVASFETTDAMSYAIDTNEPPDILLLEVMQACLESEPQVSVTRHLIQQAPFAVLVPQEVRVILKLVDSSQEFSLNSNDSSPSSPQRDRLPIGVAFALNKETASQWDDGDANHIAASTLSMPANWDARYEPMLFTEIVVYGEHVLMSYDSGLTCPRHLSVDGTIEREAIIDFVYQLGDRPRLTGKVRPPQESCK
ncbi:SAM-dependent methyltransferase [Stieleria varia]|uniref:Phytanoyl-CoA dioxygenase (PhyH) n=1 Tax=Stieleria varia TaxID=2528005 RepID=A0A5C6A3K1_9BACT|nr:hypothetical protein [Stieleria varia]TWT93781.1 hypothetical protein Pla52n_56090 [Stieleria varia]